MHDIELALKKAEALQKNLMAQKTFEKNMVFLKEKLPSLFNYFQSYKSERLQLILDAQGSYNIQNPDGVCVYQGNPEEFSYRQCQRFLEKPNLKYLTFKDDGVVKTDFIHQRLMKNMFSFYDEHVAGRINVYYKTPETLQTLIVMGVGLGYHIETLVKEKQVRNLCIYEPHTDAFYISLHTVDWAKIVEPFLRPGFNIEFCIGKPVKDSYLFLTAFFARIGMHNIIRTYLYKHYESPEVKELYELLREDLLKIALGIGFYDDERVGVAHTIANFTNKVPVARRALLQNGDVSKRAAIVIGNGPSLDANADFLRSVQGKAYLISCGTSLATLEKKGIKPDMHVEQERNLNVYDWLKGSTSAEFRKGIKFFALNTVHPKTFELFDESYMVAKPNDLGGTLLVELMERKKGNTMVLADFCNPTVTNFASSLCVTLGFRDVVLVGVDLGMLSPTEHHSKDSPYYDHQTDWDEIVKKRGLFKAKGNFRDEVWTNSILDKSRISFESLIFKYDVNFINVNDGLKINGAHSYKSSELTIEDDRELTFENELDRRIRDVFNLEGLGEFTQEAMDSHVKHVSIILDKYRTILKHPVSNLDEVYQVLQEGHYFTRKSREVSFVAKGLLKGTLEYIASTMISILCLVPSKDVPKVYKQIAETVLPYLDEFEQDALTNIYKLDNYTNYH